MTIAAPARDTKTRRLLSFCSEHRYALLAGVVLVGVTIQSLDEQWSGDVFEHLAVIRELSTRPFDPSHPVLPIETAHPFYSPYTVALGVFGYVTGFGPVTLLKIVCVVNAGLLLLAYRRFVTTVTGQRHADFYGLLAVLLLWGPDAWRLSGFLNLNSIGYGMPYPSAFATALMLFALTEVDLTIREGPRAGRLVAVLVLVPTILLTHPITGIATVTGIAGIWIGRGRVLPTRRDLPLLAALAGAVVLVSVWPYYSFWALLVDNSDYVDSHVFLYERLYLRIAPLVILGMLLATGRPKLREQPLLAWASLGVVLYVLGAFTGQAVLGRSLAFIALATLSAVGVVVARWFEHPVAGLDRAIVIVAGLLGLLGLAFASPALVRMVPRAVLPSGIASDERLASVTEPASFLSGVVDADAVVAAHPNDLADAAPAFAGKVIATPKPMPFVGDDDERRAAVRELFATRTTTEARRRRIEALGVEVVLYDERFVSSEVDEALRQLGSVVYDRGHVVVVSISV